MKQRYLNKRQKSVSKTEAYEVNKEKLKGISEATKKEKWNGKHMYASKLQIFESHCLNYHLRIKIGVKVN